MSLPLKAFKARSELDGEDDWCDVLAYNHEDAANDYADIVDSNSGGEFQNGELVTVKAVETSEIQQFRISVDYEKTFTAYRYTPPVVAA